MILNLSTEKNYISIYNQSTRYAQKLLLFLFLSLSFVFFHFLSLLSPMITQVREKNRIHPFQTLKSARKCRFFYCAAGTTFSSVRLRRAVTHLPHQQHRWQNLILHKNHQRLRILLYAFIFFISVKNIDIIMVIITYMRIVVIPQYQ